MYKKTALIILIVLILSASFVSTSPRFYNGVNKGVTWDFGGIEVIGDTGLFLCNANYDPTTGKTHYYKLAELFPSLVVDC